MQHLLEQLEFLGIFGFLCQFPDDPVFHLVRRLVGESDGQDMPVTVRVETALRIFPEQQLDVLLRKQMGLSTAGRCRDDGHSFPKGFFQIYSLLHSRLKLQYLHTDWKADASSRSGRGSNR